MGISKERKKEIDDQIIEQYIAGVPLLEIYVLGVPLTLEVVKRVGKPYTHLRVKSQLDALAKRVIPVINELERKEDEERERRDRWAAMEHKELPRSPEEIVIDAYMRGDSISDIATNLNATDAAVKNIIDGYIYMHPLK